MANRNKKIVPLNANEERQIHALASELVGRMALAQKLGQSYGGNRDIYNALGYNKSPQFDDYYTRYKRQDIAKRVIEAPVKATWDNVPKVEEGSEEDETQFEKAWDAIVKKINPFHYLARVDKISGIGQYGILFIGFDDPASKTPEKEVTTAKSVLYLRPYAQNNAEIASWVSSTSDPRYGMPETYNLDTSIKVGKTTQSKKITVHWTRVIHVAEDLFEDDVLGTPRLECVLNRLQDLELIAGGSAEMFWRGALPGYAFKADEGFDVQGQDLDALKTEIENYVHNLTRYLRLKGLSVEEMAVQIADPSNHFDILTSLISAATGIPKRILLGSERGELASTQDRENWSERISERRRDHAEPMILKPFVDRLVMVKVLPQPGEEGYSIVWQDLLQLSEEVQATITKTKTESLAQYANAPEARLIIPPAFYLSKFMGLSDDDITQIDEMIETYQAEEDAQAEEDYEDSGGA